MFENISLTSVLIFLGVVGIVWILLRFLFRFTMRIFTCGLFLLAAIGIAWVLFKIIF